MNDERPEHSRFSLTGASDTVMRVPADILRLRLSMENIARSSLERSEIEIRVVCGTTRGLTLRLCGDIGATMNTLESGVQMGPPTLSEYAVEPELVATSSPSAQ